MATFKRGTAASITFLDGMKIWDFSLGDACTNDEAIIELLTQAGAVMLEEVEVPAEEVEGSSDMTLVDCQVLSVEEMTQGMTKEQISIFAANKFDAEITVKPNKSKAEMLVELQIIIENFVKKTAAQVIE